MITIGQTDRPSLRHLSLSKVYSSSIYFRVSVMEICGEHRPDTAVGLSRGVFVSAEESPVSKEPDLSR